MQGNKVHVGILVYIQSGNSLLFFFSPDAVCWALCCQSESQTTPSRFCINSPGKWMHYFLKGRNIKEKHKNELFRTILLSEKYIFPHSFIPRLLSSFTFFWTTLVWLLGAWAWRETELTEPDTIWAVFIYEKLRDAHNIFLNHLLAVKLF